MDFSELVLELYADEQMTIKKRRVIESAIELFSENGYMATTTKEIAAKAGVAEGTIFKHFPSKSELLQSIITKTGEMINHDIQSCLLDQKYENLHDFISTIIERSYEMIKRYYPVLKICSEEVIFQRTITEPGFQELLIQVNHLIRNVIVQLRIGGENIVIHPHEEEKLISMTLLGLFMDRFLYPEKNEEDRVQSQHVADFIVNGLQGNQSFKMK
jgi:AcrR family transcriptional regulator